MTPHATRRARSSAVALLVASAATTVVLVAERPRISGSITSWRGDDLAYSTAWLLALVCAAWLTLVTLGCLAALARGERAIATRIAGWAPPIARRVLQTALVGTWALVPTYAYAAAPNPPAPLTVHVGPAGHLVGVPAADPAIEVPVVRAPPTPDRPPDTAPAVRASPAPPPSPHARAGTHVVRAGDNLWRIARAEVTRVSGGGQPDNRAVAAYWQRVVAANRSTLRSGDPSLIFAGEVVTLPGVASTD